MIIEFKCKDKRARCTYKQWDFCKAYFAKKTILYIKKLINEYLNNTIVLNESDHYEDLNMILNFFNDDYIENIDLKDENQYEIFYKKCINVFKSFNDTLIYFDIGGINVILEKEEYEGCFSKGNTYDIILLFKDVLDDIEEDLETHKSFIIEFYRLCIYSVKEQQKILIT